MEIFVKVTKMADSSQGEALNPELFANFYLPLRTRVERTQVRRWQASSTRILNVNCCRFEEAGLDYEKIFPNSTRT